MGDQIYKSHSEQCVPEEDVTAKRLNDIEICGGKFIQLVYLPTLCGTNIALVDKSTNWANFDLFVPHHILIKINSS